MQDAPKSSWTYHPLNGNEMLKWIFADAWGKLSADGQFQGHLTYHNPSYRLKLEVQAYDASNKGATNGAFAESAGNEVTLAVVPGDFEKNRIRFEMDLQSSEPLKEPDKGREMVDEGRYKTVAEDGILVDKKVKKEVKK
jgi:hypothetical protein